MWNTGIATKYTSLSSFYIENGLAYCCDFYFMPFKTSTALFVGIQVGAFLLGQSTIHLLQVAL
jgi:hypothetical protein